MISSIFEPNVLQLSRAITTLSDRLLELGLADVVISNEVNDLEIAARESGKANQVGQHFNKSLNTLPPNSVLWAGVYDVDGNCVGTVAAKYLDVRGKSLERHLVEYLERVFKSENGEQVSLNRGSISFLELVEGPFVYVGEGHVKKEWRGKNILGLLQRLLILAAYSRWQPNLLYGFMRPEKIRGSYHTKWGYTLARPSGFNWRSGPAEKDWFDPYFVGVGTEGICRLVWDPLGEDAFRRRENN